MSKWSQIRLTPHEVEQLVAIRRAGSVFDGDLIGSDLAASLAAKGLITRKDGNKVTLEGELWADCAGRNPEVDHWRKIAEQHGECLGRIQKLVTSIPGTAQFGGQCLSKAVEYALARPMTVECESDCVDELCLVEKQLKRLSLVPSRFFIGELEVITTGLVEYLERRRAMLIHLLERNRKKEVAPAVKIAPEKEEVVRQACRTGSVSFQLRIDTEGGVSTAQVVRDLMTELARVLKQGAQKENSPGGK